MPVDSIISPTVSRISDSIVTLPLRSGRVSSSSTVRTSLVTLPLNAMPARPVCHGTAYSVSLSHGRPRREGSRFAVTFGSLSFWSGCTQPSRIMRAAIQSVRTMMSRSTA